MAATSVGRGEKYPRLRSTDGASTIYSYGTAATATVQCSARLKKHMQEVSVWTF